MRRRRALAFTVLIFAVTFVNALLFTREVSNPVISEDAWYFLDVFVRKTLDGTLQARDFFIKRDASDHSQPVHKLVLLAAVYWGELDFSNEGILGTIFLGICALFIVAFAWVGTRGATDGPRATVLAIVPLAMFSLNSHEIYAWPLVSMYYVVMPLGLAMLATTALRRSWPVVGGTTLACLIAMDGGGMLFAAAAVGALLLERARGARWGDIAGAMTGVVVAVVGYRLVYSALWPELPGATLVSSQILEKLWSELPSSPKWALVPAAASLVHYDHLARWFGEGTRWGFITLGLLVLAMHVLFWRSVFRTRAPEPVTQLATGLMLMVYLAVLGIIAGRVPLFGTNYLWQHRYVEHYQLSIAAMMLQWTVALRRADNAAEVGAASMWKRIAPPSALLAVVMLQMALSANAWATAPYIRQYSREMASTLHCLGAHPEAVQVRCQPNHQVCGWPVPLRTDLVNLLREHRLNVFSSAFQARHGMAPDPARDQACLTVAP